MWYTPPFVKLKLVMGEENYGDTSLKVNRDGV